MWELRGSTHAGKPDLICRYMFWWSTVQHMERSHARPHKFVWFWANAAVSFFFSLKLLCVISLFLFWARIGKTFLIRCLFIRVPVKAAPKTTPLCKKKKILSRFVFFFFFAFATSSASALRPGRWRGGPGRRTDAVSRESHQRVWAHLPRVTRRPVHEPPREQRVGRVPSPWRSRSLKNPNPISGRYKYRAKSGFPFPSRTARFLA